MGEELSGIIIKAARIHLDAGDAQLTGMTEIVTVPMSFETGEQTTTKLYFNHRVTINKIRGIVMKAIAATDNGTITAANSAGAMTSGVITCTASDALNTEYSVTPTTNNVIEKNSYIQLVSAKTTAGGKVLVTLEVTRS